MTVTLRRKRDPEGRRLAIIEAAAELIVEIGGDAITHRKVAARAGVPLGATTQYFDTLDDLRDAAVRHLSVEVDARIEMIRRTVERDGASARVLAEILHRGLIDAHTVRLDRAVATAAIHDPQLHGLARRWSAQLVSFLAPVHGEERATAVAIFIDGVMWHALLNDAPLPQELIESALTGLLGIPAVTPAEASVSHDASVRTDREKPRV
ncbi:TetR/AcrR family transcriptional regulator [Microbacterium sp. A93]|uniref:TetR/AcrR family transcriptional regulator n=1 Tax=Microbacterium sp. A93 TaxID=3450716 RepID=UPI003F43DB9B